MTSAALWRWLTDFVARAAFSASVCVRACVAGAAFGSCLKGLNVVMKAIVSSLFVQGICEADQGALSTTFSTPHLSYRSLGEKHSHRSAGRSAWQRP